MEVTANRKLENSGETTCLHPPNELQEQQLSTTLALAENEPDNVERWKLLQRVRDLAYSLRFPPKGHSIWPPLVFASVMVAAMIFVMARNSRNTYSYTYPNNYLRIVKNVDPCLTDGSCGYRFIVQAVTDGVPGPETEMHFSGLQPRFEAGMTLSWIRYTNLGSSQEIDGWEPVRDSAGLPVLAANCKPDYTLAKVAGHIACEGGEAKF